MNETCGRVENRPRPIGESRPRESTFVASRVLFVGLPSVEGSFAEDLMLGLMECAPPLEIVAVTTPAPESFQSRDVFKTIEFVQKDDFEFIERLEQLRQGHDFHLSREVLEKHSDIYLAIQRSDPAAAKREMEFHLQELIDHNLRLMSRSENGVIARELTPEELVYSS